MFLFLILGLKGGRVKFFLLFHSFFVLLQSVMNRLEYWIKADTQYNVHSPFVFDMYRKVLFARLSRRQKQQVRWHWGSASPFFQMLYKVMDHYGMEMVERGGNCAVLEGGGEPSMVTIVDCPHGSASAEEDWERMKAGTDCQVTIDLYDVGLLIWHPKLHRQHFLLK